MRSPRAGFILSANSPAVRGRGVYPKQGSLSARRGESSMALEAAARDLPRVPWTRRHLLGLEELTRDELLAILDTAERFVDVSERRRKKRTNLNNKVVVNLFFEPSTRTRTSFGLAARRLGAEVLDFSSSGSSTSKGETFIDTAKNIEAMGIDLVVVRRSEERRVGKECRSRWSPEHDTK